MPFIALAILAGTAYQANQQRKAASEAKDQAARASEVASRQMEAQVRAQQEQAQVARETLSSSIAKNMQDRADLEKQAKSAADSIEADRRALAEQEASRIKAMRRSGSRSLLSDARLNAELGLGGGDSTLGAGLGM